MNFNENDLWTEKTDLLYLRLSKLARAIVLLKLEFDTVVQALSPLISVWILTDIVGNKFNKNLISTLFVGKCFLKLFDNCTDYNCEDLSST